MKQAETEETPARGAKSRSGKAILIGSAAILAPLIVLGIVAWNQRIAIANSALSGAMNDRGVAADWNVRDLGLDQALVSDVTIGPKDNPTLSAPMARVSWKVDLFSGRAIITDIQAENATIRLTYTEKGLDFGALAPLLESESGSQRVELLKANIANARVLLATPWGQFSSRINATLTPQKIWSGNALITAPSAFVIPGKPVPPLPVSFGFTQNRLTLASAPSNFGFQFDGLAAESIGGTLGATITIPQRPNDQLAAVGTLDVTLAKVSSRGLSVSDGRIVSTDLRLNLPAGRSLDTAIATFTAALSAKAASISRSGGSLSARSPGGTLAFARQKDGTTEIEISATAAALSAPNLKVANPEIAARVSGSMSGLDIMSLIGAGRFEAGFPQAALSAPQIAKLLRPLRTPTNAPFGNHATALAYAFEAAARDFSGRLKGQLRVDGLKAISVAVDQPLRAKARNGLMLEAKGPGSWATLSLATGEARARGTVLIRGGGAPAVSLAVSQFIRTANSMAWKSTAQLAPWAEGGGVASLGLSQFDGQIAASNARYDIAGALVAEGSFGSLAFNEGRANFAVTSQTQAMATSLTTRLCLAVSAKNLVYQTTSMPHFAARLCPDAKGKLATLRNGRPLFFGSLALDPITAQIGDGTNTQTIAIGNAIFSTEAGPQGNASRVSLPSVDIAYPLANGGTSNLSWESAGGTIRADGAGGWLFDGALQGFAATGLPVAVKGDVAGLVSWSPRAGVTATSRSISVVATDSELSPRFAPLETTGDLVLKRGVLEGRLAAALAQTGDRLGGLTLVQDFNSNTGSVIFDGDGLVFSRGGLQPSAIVPALRGVIADVEGKVDASARIAWSRTDPLSSTGRFSTADMNIATGLGPMTGITGALEMTDLLGLVSAPKQKLAVRSFNPGILIENGIVDFSLPGGNRVAIADARWPLAGGEVFLEPVNWKLGAPDQGVTLDLVSIDLERLLGLMNVPDLEMQGRVSGVFPIRVENNVARIVNGQLKADENGGVIRFKNAAMTESASSNQGTKLAFDALENFEFRILEIAVDGTLTGELTLGLIFEGKNADVLYGTPFRFNVKAVAPFAQLFRSASNMFDSTAALRLLREQISREPNPATPETVDQPAIPAQPQ